MKIYEVVSEDYDDVGLGGGTSNADSKPKTDNKSDSGDAKDQPSLSNEATKYSDLLGIDPKTLAIGAAVGVGTGVAAAGIGKITTTALSKISKDYADKLKLYDRCLPRIEKKFGPWSKLFGLIGIMTAAAQLYANLVVVEAMYVQGKLPGEDGGFEVLNAQREFEFGIFSTQVLTPAIVKLIGYLLGTTTAIKWFIRILGGASTTVSLGASWAVILASEAFTRWLQWFLGTDTARDWLREHCMTAFRVMGFPTEALISSLMGYYNKADVKKYGSQDAADKAKVDREAKKVSGLASTTGKSGRITYDDGTTIVVTDKDGYLLPSSNFEADAKMQLFRKNEIKNGRPDPLKRFPVKPGQKFPSL